MSPQKAEVVASQQVLGDTEIAVGIEAGHLEAVGQLELAVTNPEPGGGTSEPIRIDIEHLPER